VVAAPHATALYVGTPSPAKTGCVLTARNGWGLADDAGGSHMMRSSTCIRVNVTQIALDQPLCFYCSITAVDVLGAFFETILVGWEHATCSKRAIMMTPILPMHARLLVEWCV
jgi:hypothetical protein